MRRAIPTNHYSRTQLQEIVVRALSQQRELNGNGKNTRVGLHELACWAATLDAQLADLEPEYKEDSRYNHVFENPGRFEAKWMDSSHCMHTRLGLFFISLGQQVIIIPGRGGDIVATHHYRLKLGDTNSPASEAFELNKLKQLSLPYLERFKDVLPCDEDWLLDSLFGQEDIPEVRNALQKRSTT
jgi:hypothetical protein